MIDQTGRARLADFGLLTIISDPTSSFSSSSYTQRGTARWMSPELISPDRFGLQDSRPTKASDCYALGMVIYETISGHLPFHEDADLVVFVKVSEGKHPPRRVGFMNGLWGMLELCWEYQPNDRPNIEDVLQYLETGIDGEVDQGGEWDSGSDCSGMFFTTPSATFRVLSLFRLIVSLVVSARNQRVPATTPAQINPHPPVTIPLRPVPPPVPIITSTMTLPPAL